MAQQQEPPSRVVPMRVIVCGLHRTGTMSMRAALWQLGFHDVYHMHTVMQNLDSHPDLWIRAYEAKYAAKGSFGRGSPAAARADWDRLLGHSQACCDMPVAVFSPELAHLYPDAKVVVLNRDPDAWYESALHTVHTVLQSPSLAVRLRRLYCHALDPEMRSWTRFTDVMSRLGMPYDHVNDRDAAIAWFKARYREFHDRIPADRRIDFRVQDGWGPLCEHLGVPVPTVRDEATGKLVEAPFPRINDRAMFAANARRYYARSMRKANLRLFALVGRLAVVAAVAYACWLAWVAMASS